MSRIEACFATLKEQQRKALIPYITAGDPTKAITVPVMHAMVEAGADVIELGVPFSDPMADGPTVADGRVSLTLQLWAPNRRPVQVTQDLAGFWERHYPDLRKTLSRRYPKHSWPEDPLSAQPDLLRKRRNEAHD